MDIKEEKEGALSVMSVACLIEALGVKRGFKIVLLEGMGDFQLVIIHPFSKVSEVILIQDLSNELGVVA